jgi:signal transduction histidine kinase
VPRWERRWSDALVGAGVAAIAVAGVAVAPGEDFRRPSVVAVILAVAQGAPLTVRRERPLLVLVVVWASTTLFFGLRYPPVTTALLGMVLATYAVAAHGSWRSPRDRLAVTAVASVVLVAVAVVVTYSAAEGLVILLVLVTAWVTGDRTRTRRQFVATLQERSELLERERVRELRSAASAERTRIARELHDVIAHGVSVIVLHARGAKEVLDTDQDAARRSLDLIEVTGRDALQELRAVLGALRTDVEGDDLQPLQRLRQLDELVHRTRDAGLSVEVRVEGQAKPLATAVDLAAYRIVQEALANTMKHSSAATASVTLRYDRDRLVVHVVDEGESRLDAAPGGGLGLVGMEERVAMFGGHIQAGPRAGGGFEVLATLPLGDEQ